jgi:hypothetical protein
MIMQLLVISTTTKNAGRWAARALLTTPATRRGAGYAIRPLVATPFSARFQSSAPNHDSQWMAATVHATERIGDHVDTDQDDEDLDAVLDSVLGDDVTELESDDEEGAVRFWFPTPHSCEIQPHMDSF